MTLDELRVFLGQIIEEWLGYDLPEEGSEDYCYWQSMHDELDAIETLRDVVNFLNGCGIDPEEWFESLDLEFPAVDDQLDASAAKRRIQ